MNFIIGFLFTHSFFIAHSCAHYHSRFVSYVTQRRVIMPCCRHIISVGSRMPFFHTVHTHTHCSVTYASPNHAALEDLSSSGRDAVVCMQRLLKRTGFWSASVVRIDLLQAPMPAAGGKTAANQADRADIVPKLGGSREVSQAC